MSERLVYLYADPAGNYYAGTRNWDDPVRVPDAQWGAIDRLIEGGDTSGFLVVGPPRRSAGELRLLGSAPLVALPEDIIAILIGALAR